MDYSARRHTVNHYNAVQVLFKQNSGYVDPHPAAFSLWEKVSKAP